MGIINKQYLSGDKTGHWLLGAEIAYKLFGTKGYKLVAGHTNESGWPKSELFWADKKCWLIKPIFILKWNDFIEGFSKKGVVNPEKWRILVKQGLEQDNPIGGHALYLKYKHRSK